MATITGTSGNDNLNGTSGNDTLNGLGGNDTLVGSAGADFYDGGTGTDVLDLSATGAAVALSFASGTISGGFNGTFVNIERVLGGSGADSLIGAAGNQRLESRGGNDTLAGGAGVDTLWGGGGADTFVFRETGTANADTIGDFASGSDKIVLDASVMTALGASGNFAAGDARFAANSTGTAQDASDRLIFNTTTRQVFYDADGSGSGAAVLIATLQSGATLAATDIVVEGASGAQPINGTAGDDALAGGPGDDTINGLAGNDTLSGLDGDDTIDGGTGVDSMLGGAGADVYFVDDVADSIVEEQLGGADLVNASVSYTLPAWVNNLTLSGTAALDATGNDINNVLTGNSGANVLSGGAGADTLSGGGGSDVFLFAVPPGGGSADVITDFVSGADKLTLDASVMTALGTSGNFSAGDARFAANSTGTAEDAADRVIFNTTTRQIFYDADGSGSGAAALIATLQSGASLVATDIVVQGGGQVINGTAGNDSLVGGAGSDTINGLGGNDTLVGGAGDDSLTGGEGIDTLEGGDGNDTLVAGPEWGESLSGGLGDDTYYVAGWPFNAIAPDPGGIDAVFSEDAWTLGEGLENLTLIGTEDDNTWAQGNSLDNVITGNADGNSLAGFGGNDTLRGEGGNDTFSYSQWGDQQIDYGSDVVDGGAGLDEISFFSARSGITLNFAAGTVSGGGAGGTGAVAFTSIEQITGSDFVDRLDAGGSGAAMVFNGRDGNDTLLGASGADSLTGGEGDDQLLGGAGNDVLTGEGGADRIEGGAGDDLFVFVWAPSAGQDTLDGGEGADTLQLWSRAIVDLGAGIAGTTAGSSNLALLANVENVVGGFDQDTLIGSAAANLLDGGAWHDSLDGAAGNDTVLGGTGNDTLRSGAGTDSVAGGDGEDWIVVDAGADTVSGGAGRDRIVFDQPPSAANADLITDFASGTDELVLDAAAFASIGDIGNFLPGDERFYAAAGATSGHDDTDRVVYDTATGRVFYDADGSGSGAAVLIATLQDAPSIAAPDILVMANGVSGMALTGTLGHDRLEGGSGNDSLQGLSGNDTLIGNRNHDVLNGGAGSDSMLGGEGNDTLSGGIFDWWETDRDTMDGGAGNDTYVILRNVGSWNPDQVVLIDSGGIDTIVALSGDWVLGAGFENLQLDFDFDDEGLAFGTGNELDNVITGFQGGWVWNFIDGADGNDTLLGGAGRDSFAFAAGSGNIGHDSIDGGGDVDWVDYRGARSGVVVDMRAGTASGGGNGGSGGATLVNIEAVSGSALDDVLIARDTAFFDPDWDMERGPVLYGAGGNDTLIGGAVGDSLAGDRMSSGFFGSSEAFGDDVLRGNAGNDSLEGGRGSDWLDGGSGADHLTAGPGADTFAFTAAPGSANADTLADFESALDVLRFDTAVYAALGQAGRFAAGDERFYAAGGAVAGHDATDRIIYDAGTGNLYYDADGSGAGAAQLIATGITALAATDIVVGVSDSALAGQSAAATSGNDALFGTAGDDTLDGLAGNDSLLGNAGGDVLFGRDGDDTLDGGGGNDTMDGDAGDDTYFVRSLSDVLIDSGGRDTVIVDPGLADYALRAGFENLSLRGAEGEGIGNELDNLLDGKDARNVWLEGRDGDDTLIGSDAQALLWIGFSDVLYAGEGDDVVQAGGGHDLVEGWLGDDFISGGDGHDWLFGGRNYYPLDGDGNDTVEGEAGDDYIQGGEGDDVLRGGAGNDNLWGEMGADSLFGGEGDDHLHLSEFGWDVLHNLVEGGPGTDWLSFEAVGSTFGALAPVIVDLQAGSVSSRDSWWGTGSATLADIENVMGGRGSDLIIGSSAANFLAGAGGRDTLDGGAGNDTLLGHGGGSFGSQGETYVFSAAPGAANADVISSFNPGGDTIVLDATAMPALGASGRFSTADGRFYVAAGATGGHDADDRVIFDTTTKQLFYDADGSGPGAGQLLFTMPFAPAASDIEVVNGGPVGGRVVLTGSAANDSLQGGSGDDVIAGGAGDDTLQGGEGADVIAGGAGRDILTGGAGRDQFVFSELPGAADADRITDFTTDVDSIQLDGELMTNLGRAGDLFGGDGRFWAAAGATAGHDADDRIVYDTTTGNLYYDPDGNGAAGAQLIVTLQPGTALQVIDFVIEGEAAETIGEIVHPPLSGDLRIDALLGDFVAWERLTPGDNVIQYTFSVTEGNQRFGPQVEAFNAALQDAARQVLGDASAITGIVFQEVADGTAADLHFANAALSEFGAVGLFSWDEDFEFDANGALLTYQADGYVYLDGFTQATPGTFEYQVLLHEVGHALGLKHPHEFPVQLLPGDDNNSNTVMTYEDTFAPQDEFQEFDVAALHWIYGGDGLGGAGARASGTPPTFGTQASELLRGGEGHDLLWGDSGQDTLIGGAGNDWVLGGAGRDFLDGGAGDDRYAVTAGDVLADSGGIDTVYSEVSWTLAAGFENLRFQLVYSDGESQDGTGNELANVISGHQGNNVITGLEGDDSLYGWGSDDTFVMSFAAGSSYGADFIDGGLGTDTIDFSTGASAVVVELGAGSGTGGGTSGAGSVSLVAVESVVGTAFADRIVGDGAANALRGGAGRDTLTGAAGMDLFLFAAALQSADADLITDFGATDALGFDAGAFTRIGAANFVAGDARFHAAAGATGGHDTDDRIVYDSAAGNIYYDADGSGSGNAVLIATLQGAPILSAAQVDVLNGRTEAGVNLAGTSGSDTMAGGAGRDTLAGLGGNDVLSGMEGEDSLDGADGSDSLDGGAGADTLNGGLGDDTYVSDGDAIIDAGGVDTVVLAGGPGITLPAGIENLIVPAAFAVPLGTADIALSGNDAANLIRVEAGVSRFVVSGGAGDDTLFGGSGAERFTFGGAYGDDSVDGGAGFDWLEFGDDSAAVIDFSAGMATGGGVGSVRFTNVEAAAGGSRDDRLTAGALGVQFAGGVGNDTLVGGAGNDRLDGAGIFGGLPSGEAGADSLSGGGGADTLGGGAGSDTLAGGLGMDSLWGGGEEGSDGGDVFVFDVAPGSANADRIFDFEGGVDSIELDGRAMTALGSSGAFTASDARFAANSAGTAQDASDRVVYNTSKGELWYDADGTGAGTAQLIATLHGAPSLAATDISVINGAVGGSVINGTSGADTLSGTAGNDTINGLEGNDLFLAGSTGGADVIDGGAGRDSIEFKERATSAIVVDFVAGTITGGSSGTISFTNIERVLTGNFDDRLTGNAAAQTLTGQAGADTIAGAGGVDTLWGAQGADVFVFREMGTANADRISDFATGSDKLHLDDAAFTAIGATGNFGAGDGRFAANSSGTAQDGGDRVVFNTSTGQLYYDADGSGGGAAQLIATVQSGATVAATDIVVI